MRDLVAKFQGEAEACKRHVLAADAVTADTRGLQQLVAAGNYRAAINHTALLLEMYGQGRSDIATYTYRFLLLPGFRILISLESPPISLIRIRVVKLFRQGMAPYLQS